MHPCLQIPEITAAICYQVYDWSLYVPIPAKIGDVHLHGLTSLLATALTCKDLLEPALDQLWSRQTSLLPLLRCLPEELLDISSQDTSEDDAHLSSLTMVLEQAEAIPVQQRQSIKDFISWIYNSDRPTRDLMKLTRDLQDDDFRRVDFYAHRVRHFYLKLSARTARAVEHVVSQIMPFLSEKSTTLFPLLHTLEISRDIAIGSKFLWRDCLPSGMLSLVIGPSLQNVKVSLDKSGPQSLPAEISDDLAAYHGIQDLITSTLRERCSSLQLLDLHVLGTSKLAGDLRQIFEANRQLSSLGIVYPGGNPEGVAMLSAATDCPLTRLSLDIGGAASITELMTLLKRSETMRHLSLSFTADVMLRKQESHDCKLGLSCLDIEIGNSVRRLPGEVPEGMPDPVFEVLQYMTPSELRHLQLTYGGPPVDYPGLIGHITSFNNLVDLTITTMFDVRTSKELGDQEICKLAQSCPKLVSLIFLDVSKISAHYLTTRVTHKGVRELFAHCSELSILHLSFDASTVQSDASFALAGNVSNTNMLFWSLNVSSPIVNPVAVAVFLTDMLPFVSLRRGGMKSELQGQAAHNRELWNTVADLMPLLQSARRQHLRHFTARRQQDENESDIHKLPCRCQYPSF